MTVSAIETHANKSKAIFEASLAENLKTLEQMNLAKLRVYWAQHYGEPLALRSAALLRSLIAWRLQTRAYGGLSEDVKIALRRKGVVKSEGLELGEGAKLTRIWLGRKVEVVVEADGFSWDGKRFKSLSAVARAITGTRWNGPRFFGLRGQ